MTWLPWRPGAAMDAKYATAKSVTDMACMPQSMQ